MLIQSKKMLSLLLTVCLIIGLMATSSFAKENGHVCNVCKGAATGCEACEGTGQCPADWDSETGVCKTCDYQCEHTDREYCTDSCPTCGKTDEHNINSETGMCEMCNYTEDNNGSDGDSGGDSGGNSSGDSSCEHEWNSSTGKCNKCSILCVHDYRSGNGICATCLYTCDHPEYYLEYRPYGNLEHSVRCADCGLSFKKERCVDENKNDSYSCDICKKSVVSSDNGISIDGNRNYFTFTPTAAGKYTIFCSNSSVMEGIILEVYLPNKSESNFDFNVIDTCDLTSQAYTLEVTTADIGKTYTLLCRDHYDRQMSLKYTLNIINSTCMQKINVGDHFKISQIGTSWFSFTPTESGNYTVVSTGKENTKLSVWLKRDDGVIDFADPETYRIASSDAGGLNDNFSYSQNFEKDKEYILECSKNDGSYGEYDVYLIDPANCSHLWNQELSECELCKAHCSHNQYSNGVCTTCAKVCTHDNYSNGIQSIVKATTSADGKVIKTCITCGNNCTESVIAKIASIKLTQTSFIYSGLKCTPGVVVYDANGKAISSFNATYPSETKNVGTYTVDIVFDGNYSGSTQLVYTIIPKTPSFKLSKGSKNFKVNWSKISSQCSGYQIQYSLNSSFKGVKTKTIPSFKKTSAKVSSLKSKKVYYVRMRSYKKLEGKTYYSGWSSKKSIRVK